MAQSSYDPNDPYGTGADPYAYDPNNPYGTPPPPQAPAPPTAPTPPTPPTPPPGGGTGGAPTTGYDVNALRQALMAHTATANAASLKAFIAAHPEFATGVTIGGTKGNKLYGPDGTFLADVIRGTSGTSPSWDWDTSTGGSSNGATGNAIDPSYLAPFTGQFSAPGSAPDVPTTPDFTYGDFSGFDPFTAPTGDSMVQDPSYQFRLGQGAGALENSAAARGVLNTGGTLKDILGYGQNFASQEYGNIWNRDFNTWNATNQNKLTDYTTNRNNAASNFATNYGLSTDRYNMLNNANTDAYNRAWSQFGDQKNTFYANQTNPFNKLSTLASLGLTGASQ